MTDRAENLLVAHPDWETLQVKGPDRLSWLNGLLTCDVDPQSPGRGAFGLILNKQGKIQSDVSLVYAPDSVWMAVAENTAKTLTGFLEHHLIMEDAEVADKTPGVAWICHYGATSSTDAAPSGTLAWGHIDWSGSSGTAWAVPRASLKAAAAELSARMGVALAQEQDWERFRITHGMPRFGADFDQRHNPHDAALERRAVSWTKGCYLGQEVVCMLDMRGKVKQRLLPLRIETSQPLEPGAVVSAGDGARAGEVTSCLLESTSGPVLAMARLNRPFYEEGQQLYVASAPATPLRSSPA